VSIVVESCYSLLPLLGSSHWLAAASWMGVGGDKRRLRNWSWEYFFLLIMVDFYAADGHFLEASLG